MLDPHKLSPLLYKNTTDSIMGRTVTYPPAATVAPTTLRGINHAAAYILNGLDSSIPTAIQHTYIRLNISFLPKLAESSMRQYIIIISSIPHFHRCHGTVLLSPPFSSSLGATAIEERLAFIMIYQTLTHSTSHTVTRISAFHTTLSHSILTGDHTNQTHSLSLHSTP